MASITASTIPLGDKAYTNPFYSIGVEICQNLLLEQSASENSKAAYYLLKIPGMKRLGAVDAVNKGACRVLITTGLGRTFGVFGNAFCEIDQNGGKLQIGTLYSKSGQIQAAENGRQMILVDGNAGYIFDFATTSFNPILDEFFPGNAEGTSAPTHVVYNDTRFIVNNVGTNEYYYSNPYYQYNADNSSASYDPAVFNGYWNPIQSGRKFAQADNIVGLSTAQNYVWLFGYSSCEVHYDTGNYNGQLYARYDGAIINVGCHAPQSIANLANNVFWLGTDKTGILGVFTNDGMQPRRISKRGIEQIIESMSVYEDAIGWTYSHAGHSFYNIYFPTASKSFVFDLTTDSWHERTFLDKSDGKLYAHKALYATANFNKVIIGHNSHSTIFEFDANYYQNDNAEDAGVNYIKCIKTTPINFQNGVFVRYNAVQPILQQGVGLAVNNIDGVGTDPLVWIAWSDDAGRSWSSEFSAPMGKLGEYNKRSRILTAGLSRNRVWRIAITDPVQVILVGLIVEALPTRF